MLFRRKKSSLDYNLLLAYSFCLLGQCLLPINGTARTILAILLASFLVPIAVRYRKQRGWQWKGLKTIDLLKSTGVLLFGTFYAPFMFVHTWYDWVYGKAWVPSSLSECISEISLILPIAIRSKHPEFTVLIVSLTYCIFAVLVMLKVAYFSAEAFIKDCELKDVASTDNPIVNSYDSTVFGQLHRLPFFVRPLAFFLFRPFILKKERDSVRVEFFKVSAYDLRANYQVAGFGTVAFSFFTYAIFAVGVFGRPTPDDFAADAPSDFLIMMQGFWIMQIAIFVVLSYTLWRTFVRNLLVKTVIDFRSDYLVIGETFFGYYRKVCAISQDDLAPLVEKPSRTTIPHVRNSTLMVWNGRRQIELAGHLLPEAMDSVQSTYDNYCALWFNQFYDDTEPMFLR